MPNVFNQAESERNVFDDALAGGNVFDQAIGSNVQSLNKTAKLAKLEELKKKNAPESSWMSDILGKVGEYGVAPIANLPKTIGELGVGAANLLSFNSPTSPNRPFKTGVPILPEGSTKGILDPIQPFIRGMNLPGPKGLTEEIAARVQGAGPAVDEAARSLTTPENLIAMAAGGASKTLAKPVTALFTGDTVAALPEAVRQAVAVEQDPNATTEQKGAAWANPALNLTVGALLAKHLGKGEAPPESITAKDRVETDKTFGDVTTQASLDLPKDQVTTNPTFNKLDVERSRQQEVGKSGAGLLRDTVLSRPSELDVNGLQLPETTGSYGLKSRFQGPMYGPPRDLSQLSPAELAELDRGPNPVYTPPKEKTMDTPIIGEQHPLTQPLANLSTAIADLQASLNKGQIVSANQAATPEQRLSAGTKGFKPGPAGGQVSFASSANAESIPSARQSALQPNETITSNPTGSSSQIKGTTPGTLQSAVEKIRTDNGGNVEDQTGTGKVDVGGQGTESGQGLYGEGLEAKKQDLIAQLKAAPTIVEKQKLWGQIEALKNTKQQEVQTVPIQNELKDKLNRYAASRKNMGEAGGIDMSVLEDVVKYGKTLFKQGMDKATWASDMVKKLGENVRPYLDEAHKNVVPAMQNRGDRTFGLQAEDVLKNPLDLKLKPDAKGEFDSGQLVGRTLNMVSPAEKQFLEDAGIRKEFPPGTRVSGEKVGEWVRENGPKVEVRKFGEDPNTSKLKTEHAQLVHNWFERQGDLRAIINDYEEGVNSDDKNQSEAALQELKSKAPTNKEWWDTLNRWVVVSGDVHGDKPVDGSSQAHWSAIAPKPESDMPGYVEGAVTIPLEGKAHDKTGNTGIVNTLFPSSHNFPPNTFGFFRGYMDKTPEGKKAFHVFEVQSDWAQKVREMKENQKQTGYEPGLRPSLDRDVERLDHPLLRDWSRLTLKAAVDHAIKEGADEIAIQDSKSLAMMEGHDQAAQYVEKQFNSLKEAKDFTDPLDEEYGYPVADIRNSKDKWSVQIPKERWDELGGEPSLRKKGFLLEREAGDTLHYDRILPNIVKELTGEEGRKVELGEHKMAREGGNAGNHGKIRDNLVFNNPDNTPKTSITAQSFPLDKVKEQLKTKPFSFFGSDKPKIPSAETVASKLEPKPRGIVAGARAAMEKNQEAGRVGLPTKEEVGKAIDYAKSAPKRILDHIIGHGVDRETGEIVDHILAKQQGWSAPRTVSANEDVGNKLVRYASADIAADQYAKALASEALGDTHYKDTAFQDKLGKVIVEERLRSLQQYHEGKNESELAASVSHVMTPTEFDSALKDPEIKAAVERHKQIVQPVAEEQHTALGGKLAAKGPETGAFANLLAVTDADSFETAKQLIYGQGNVNPRAAIKGSVFEKRATGQAPKYETNYRTVAERMISGNYKRNALRNWIDAGVKAGLYKYAKAGEGVPEMGGEPMVRVPVKIKATPWGSQVIKDLWVRKDLSPELTQALSGGGAPLKAGIQVLLDLATEAQIIGPTDVVFHMANEYGSIVGSLGAKTAMRDIARKLTGVKQLDAVGRIAYHAYRTMLDSPEVQKELAELAKIGGLRDQKYKPSLLGKATGGILDTGKWIRIMDTAGRLARNQMFDNLVERGWVKDNELNRREWANKMGQYNSKLMSSFQARFQQYTSQFVVAGRTFNRNAFQRVLMSNEVRAANPSAYWKMKALNMLGVMSTLFIIPMAANYAINGQIWGRPGTPVGKIDLGPKHDDKNGKHTLFDPAQTELLRRGMRITGGQALIDGIRQDRPQREVIGRMFEDIFRGQMHPWTGPPLRIGQAYIEQQAKDHDVGKSLESAMAAVNPTLTAYLGKDDRNPEREGLTGVGESLEGAVGFGKSRLPTHTEKVESTMAKYGMPDNLKGRSDAEKQVKANATPQTREEKERGAEYSIKQEVKRGEGLESAMNPTDLQFVKRRGFDIPGFPDRINFRGQNVVLKDSEVKTLQSYILEEDIKTIQKFKSGRWDAKPPSVQKEIFHDLIVDGRDRARTKLMKQLR